MRDAFEMRYGLNPFVNDALLDTDEDGWSNLQEANARTNPNRSDTDNDGIPDPLDPQPTFNPALVPIIELILSE